MILVNVLLGFSQFFRAIPIMNPLPWFMIAQAPYNPGHSALVMTSDSPGNHEGLATPLVIKSCD